jgi:FHA domain
MQRPAQPEWKREIRAREEASLDELRADLERGGLASVREAERPYEPPFSVPDPGLDVEQIAVAVAVLQLLDGTLIGMVSCHADAGFATIGRGRDAAIRIHDPYVSRIHATIHWDPDGQTHVLSDRGAQNGTYINGRRISTPTRVLDGARIRLGTTEVHYYRRDA